TAVTKTEILYGIELMPPGRKRESLHQVASKAFQEQFMERVLPFDQAAASIFAVLAANRRKLGRPIGQFDCQIAAIARVNGASLATRDKRDFADCGVELIDPWAS
ncbi:MAG: type II toxin-antitoxin system VapC family toxin, partial [Acidobacteriota bacterium]|nr:type II toxin-antitoxin system VapC family toxin [Acidobacteriota bacterium]